MALLGIDSKPGNHGVTDVIASPVNQSIRKPWLTPKLGFLIARKLNLTPSTQYVVSYLPGIFCRRWKLWSPWNIWKIHVSKGCDNKITTQNRNLHYNQNNLLTPTYRTSYGISGGHAIILVYPVLLYSICLDTSSLLEVAMLVGDLRFASHSNTKSQNQIFLFLSCLLFETSSIFQSP